MMQHKNLLARNFSVHEDLLERTAIRSDRGLLRSEAFSVKYLNLKLMHDLQTGIVRHFLHNLMTPVCAMSGYLELLRERLNHGAGDEKLERYSEKVAEGLDEVGILLDQLHELYKLKSQNQEGDHPEVNLNWIIEEVTGIINSSFELRSRKIICTSDKKPVFIQADLFQIKLMIHNMITAADQFCTENSQIEINAEATREQGARLTIRCTGETLPNRAFIRMFRQGVSSSYDDTDRPSAAHNLIISCRMARQIGGNIEMIEEPGGARRYETLDERSENVEKQSPLLVCTLPLAQIQEFV